ncbi:MAG: MIP/aquaporin family protein [Pygmaiobacter sp.]
MLPYIAEFVGTALLILLGDGVVANVTLNKSGMKGAGSIQIMVPGYIAAQICGAFTGACLVYALFKDQFDATEDAGTKLGVFSTGPSVPHTFRNILSEAIGTFVLVFAIKGLGNVIGCASGVEKLLVFGIIVSIGMSLGGLTGYAINPARDLGPRIAHAVLPIAGKGDSNFSYGLVVPIVGPILGALLAVGLFAVIPW